MGDKTNAESSEDESKVTGLPTPPEPISTQHSITIDGGPLDYQATFGLLPLENADGEIEATLSFTYYSKGHDDPAFSPRPLSFLFNGGPGSASVWLHIGGLGPKRIQMEADGGMPPPPFDVVDNEHTWLDFSDLVFVDPVETGYSKAASDELKERFLSRDGDLDICSDFIRLFLTQYNRWTSPLFLGGESYGTFRSAGLAGKLAERGIVFNGVFLISSVLELGTLLFGTGDDLPYVLFLPSFTATAWYHQALPEAAQSQSLESLLSEVEQWTVEQYAPMLAKGAAATDDDIQHALEQLQQYTGLDQAFIKSRNLRINQPEFCRELLRSEGKIVGRLDSRHTGYDPVLPASTTSFDPSMSAIRAPFTAAINTYVRRDLGYESDAEYQILRRIPWKWGDADNGTPRTTREIEEAFSRNPYMHLLVTSGYFDLATAYFATKFTLGRLNLSDQSRSQITTHHYEGGHMTYVAAEEMKQFKEDVGTFVNKALDQQGSPLKPAEARR